MVPENIHTPTTEGIGNSEGGVSEAQEIPEGRGVQGLQIRQNCSDDSTEVMEGVTLTPEIFGNKQGAA